MSRTDAILTRLLSLHPKLIDLHLERVERLLEALGRPQDRLPPVIHVAGTNGKGSTIAYLRAMLEAADKRVHVYTSPHLCAFRERIRLAGTLVSNRQLNAALEACEEANAGQPITFFEITTAAAIMLFAEIPADYLLLEVGLGGEFDSTNVIDHPLGTIITPVSIDHVQFLGETIREIAAVKAGILKRGAPAVLGRQTDEGLASIRVTADRLGVVPFVAGEDYDGFSQRGRFVYQDETGLLDLPLPALHGAHQVENAAIAVAAVRHFGLPVDGAAIDKGLRSVRWPARLTPLHGALNRHLAPGQELWLDGGHNPAGARVLSAALDEMNRSRPAPLVLVTGMMGSKDADGFFSAFNGSVARAYAVPIPSEANALSARALADLIAERAIPATTARSVQGALTAIALEHPEARVVICGSLYLAGAVLRLNGTCPE